MMFVQGDLAVDQTKQVNSYQGAMNRSQAGLYGGHPGGVILGTPAPKEIGLLQRVEGALTGVEEIRSRLEGLSARIHGEPMGLPDGPNAAKRQSGMPAALSQIEGEIRECLNLLARLSDQF